MKSAKNRGIFVCVRVAILGIFSPPTRVLEKVYCKENGVTIFPAVWLPSLSLDCQGRMRWDETLEDRIAFVCTHGHLAQALEEEGRWTRRWLSEPAAYMPRNSLLEESAKRIRYAVFHSHSGLID